MSSSWVRHNLHSEPIPKVPDTEYPIAVRGYGGMYSAMRGTTRKVGVAFQRLDVDGAQPFHQKISFSHLRYLRVGSVLQNKCIVGDVRYDTFEAQVNFSSDYWRLISPQTEINAGRPAPFMGKYRPMTRDERMDRTWSLEFHLPDGRTLLVPCLEFLLRCYGASELIPRALTSRSWDDAVKLFLKSTTPEINSKGRWVIRPTDSMVKADRSFLAHILHTADGRDAAKSLADQCIAEAQKQKYIFPRVIPWFSAIVRVAAEGIWINPGKTFLALRIKSLNNPPGHPISEVRTVEDELFRREDEESPHLAREGAPRFTLSAESNLKLHTVAREINLNGGPPENKRKQEPWFPTGSDRDIETVYERRSNFVVPPANGEYLTTTSVENNLEEMLPTLHRVVVAHGTLLEMWTSLLKLKDKYPANLSSVQWLNPDFGFESSGPPELIPFRPFGKHEDADKDAREFVTKDIEKEPPRGLLVLRLQVMAPKTLERKTVYLLEIERRLRRNSEELIEDPSDSFRGLVAVLASMTEFRTWLQNTMSRIRYSKGKVIELKSQFPDLIDVFKHSKEPPGSAALLALSKVGIGLK